MNYKLIIKFLQRCIKLLPVYKIQIFSNEISIFLDERYLSNTLKFLRYNLLSQFKILTSISGTDYPEINYRFEVVYDLLSLTFNNRLRIKLFLHELSSADTVYTIYPAAGWYECEVWDMYGVFFKNHHNLRRILTDYGFEGHPLRKDFPLSGFIEVKYSDLLKRVINEPLELAQEYRTFDFSVLGLIRVYLLIHV